MRVVEEERTAVELGEGIAQKRHETDAVNVLIGPRGESGHLEQGRIKVGADGGGGASGPGRGDPGPAHHGGHADAALVDPTFASAVGQVGGGKSLRGGDAAVVGSENDRGGVAKVQLVELGENAADGCVHALDHGGVDGVVLPDAHGAGLLGVGPDLALAARVKAAFFDIQPEGGGFLFVFVDELLRGLQGRVDRVEAQVEEEGLVRLGRLFDEGGGFLGEAGGEVFAIGAGRQVGDVFVRREVAVRHTVFTASTIHLKSLVGGQGTVAAEVPFADVAGAVACLLEGLGHGHFGKGQLGLKIGGVEFAGALSGEEIRRAEARGRFAGEDARTGRRADRRSGIEVGEDHPTGGEAVEVGRFVKATGLVETDILIPEVVGENEEDVQLVLRDCRQGRAGETEQHEGKPGGEKAGLHTGHVGYADPLSAATDAMSERVAYFRAKKRRPTIERGRSGLRNTRKTRNN